MMSDKDRRACSLSDFTAHFGTVGNLEVFDVGYDYIHGRVVVGGVLWDAQREYGYGVYTVL